MSYIVYNIVLHIHSFIVMLTVVVLYGLTVITHMGYTQRLKQLT